MNKNNQEPAPPRRAMIIVAHPDDIEFIMGGTMAKWAQAGTGMKYVVVTSGDAGSHEPGMTREELARIRETEQRAAAQVIGVNEVVFLGYHDCEVELTLALRRDLVREVRRFKPDTVVCFDPSHLFIDNQYINHPDHRAVGQAALDAVAPTASMPLAFAELKAEGLEAHAVKEVWVAVSANPDTWIDITSTMDLKLQALSQHVSQMPEGWHPEEMTREWSAASGAKIGVPYAEEFKRIVLVKDEND